MPHEGFKTGILALQGGFSLHEKALRALGAPTKLVRTPADLAECDRLILPGGESTTLTHLLAQSGLHAPFLAFAKHRPVFGTCAGLILLAKEKLLPLTLLRNAYGSQSASFATTLTFQNRPLEAIFIRAPQITHIHSPEVETLITHSTQAVCVRYNHLLGATFHPELTNDLSLHSYFLQILVR